MAEGTEAGEVARLAKEWGAAIVGVNCAEGPMAVLAAVEKMVPVGLPVLAAPNAGLPRRIDERMVYVSTPEYFGVYAHRMVYVGARLLGGCCGTTPEHIRRIAAAVRMAGGTAPDAKSPDEIASSQEPFGITGGGSPAGIPRGAIEPTPLAE